MSKPRKDKCAAVITIRRASNMTPAGRKRIALWLRRAGDALLRDGNKYANRFTARYLYR